MSFVGYKASPWQSKFHSRTETEVLGAGAAGPGKTRALIWDPFQQIQVEHERCKLPETHPHYHPWGSSVGRALHLRRAMPMLTQSIDYAKALFPQVDKGVKWNENLHTFTFASGFKYQFGHCLNKGDWIQYIGLEFTWIGYDELIQFERNQYTLINSRLRTSDPVLINMMKIRSVSNPLLTGDGEFSITDPWWVRDYFVQPWPEGNRVIKRPVEMDDGTIEWHTRLYLPATLADNPDPVFRRKYEANLANLPEHMRAALKHGDWFAVAGAHYSDVWRKDRHVCRPFKVPRDWAWMRSMDWGYKNPGVIYWGVLDPDDTLWVVKEYKFQGMHATEVAMRVRDVEQGLGLWSTELNRSKLTGPADTQIWEERGNRALSLAEEFNAVGVFWVRADKKSRARNAQRLIARLKSHVDDADCAPGIVIFETCREIVTTLPSIPSEAGDPESPAKGPRGGHAHEALLYLVAYATREHGAPLEDKHVEEIDGNADWGLDGYGSQI